MEKIPMTAAGYAALETELKHRQQVERPRIIQQITDARTHGDLSENAEYHAAKEQQSHNEGRIAELEDKLARAEVIDVSKLSGDTIKFGATVTLIDEDTDKKQVWQIVGEPEADAKAGKHLDHLAARARADRQEEGRVGRGGHARRRQGLRGHEDRVEVGALAQLDRPRRVIAGLDPAIHDDVPCLDRKADAAAGFMDGRVKPGHDADEAMCQAGTHEIRHLRPHRRRGRAARPALCRPADDRRGLRPRGLLRLSRGRAPHRRRSAPRPRRR